MYAKVIDDEIVFARIEFEGWTNVETGVLTPKPTEQDFIDAGYQKVIQTNDDYKEDMLSIPYYEVENGEIVQHWRYEPIDNYNAL